MIQKKITIRVADHEEKCIVLTPRRAAKMKNRKPMPCILWIHGGGYVLGMASMVHMSCGKMLAKEYGAVVVSPEYRLASEAPYPAALEDCYGALEYIWDHAEELGVDRNRIVVGGESAGGGLAVAVCLYARDKGKVKVYLQLPLYPMLDCEDTSSSKDNHGKVWNTKRNHWGWKKYLGDLYGSDHVPPYASPARETNYENLPPCYTFVCEGEPFFQETVDYVEHLLMAGVRAKMDVYPGDIHAFDMLCPWLLRSRKAKKRLCSEYMRYFAKRVRGVRIPH